MTEHITTTYSLLVICFYRTSNARGLTYAPKTLAPEIEMYLCSTCHLAKTINIHLLIYINNYILHIPCQGIVIYIILCVPQFLNNVRSLVYFQKWFNVILICDYLYLKVIHRVKMLPFYVLQSLFGSHKVVWWLEWGT